MKQKLVVVLLVAVLLGCGQVEEQVVYDTAGNPNNFPPLAIGLLVNLENGQLIGGEAITEVFGKLYTQHSELLDREDWKAVIDQLGGKFGLMADSLQNLGIGSYTLASEYYQLGSFARPDDLALRRQAALFGTWLRGCQDSLANLSGLTGDNTPTPTNILSALRYFLQPSSLHQEFYKTHLLPEMKGWIEKSDLLDQNVLEQLPPPDRALLVSAGLVSE